VSSTRLRFAPAPTGYMHLGSARTALFNWLYARHTGGELVLRIEDTNAELARPELIDNIYRSLEWLGIDWDGETVRQSERASLYDAAVEKWLADDVAYVADGAVRFRVPDQGVTKWHDEVRGLVEFENEHIEDFVVRRSDGTATFFTANAVDDLELKITHVVRGEDLLNATPKIILLRQALGAVELPVFAHLPLIVNSQRKKLSKRRDDVALESYRGQGVLGSAMANYLALLGWGPSDDIEVRPIEEIVDLFELSDVNASAAMFDIKKLEAVNGDYIRAMLLEQAPAQLDFFFLEEPIIDIAVWEKVMSNLTSVAILEDALTEYKETEWVVSALHETLLNIGEKYELKLGKAQAPVRAALTGRSVGPPLFESMLILGRDVVTARLDRALKHMVLNK
jgi:glutamyl-tRNA synthetase